MPDDLTLRPIAPADHDRILELNEASVEHLSPLDAERLEWMLSMASFALVAVEGPSILGFAIGFDPGTAYDSANYRWWAERAADFVYLDRIVVAADVRGRGVASRLYDRLEDQARPRGAVVAEVNVDPPNHPSLAFHAGRGYVEHGRRGVPGEVVAMLRLDL